MSVTTELRDMLDAHGIEVTVHRPMTKAELAQENARLRELCKDMMAFIEDDDACERCGHDAECVEAADGELVLPYEGLCLMLGLFADRMRELGVEVPE